MSKKLPRVALIGRVNVGKSTLLNRLSESTRAIVSPHPGTTRDLLEKEMFWGAKTFILTDSGGFIEGKNTTEIDMEVVHQTESLLANADVIVWVLDNKTGLTAVDRDVERRLRKLKKPIIIGVNKVDKLKERHAIDDAIWKMGFKNVVLFSARNGSGTGDLLDEIIALLPKKQPQETEKQPPRITIVGRPNVGKSTLLNTLARAKKAIVSGTAHTTRDTQDIEVAWEKKLYTFTDTAGIRKKSKVGAGGYSADGSKKYLSQIEKASLQQVFHFLPRSEVIVLMLDASEGIQSQDQKIADLITNFYKPVIIMVNKWDAVEDKDPNTMKNFEKYIRLHFPHLSFAKVIFVSALEKQHITNIFTTIEDVMAAYKYQVNAGDLAQFLEKFIRMHPVKRSLIVKMGQAKKPAIIKRLTQTDTEPVEFSLHTPHPKDIPIGWLDLMKKELYAAFPLAGCPVKLITTK